MCPTSGTKGTSIEQPARASAAVIGALPVLPQSHLPLAVRSGDPPSIEEQAYHAPVVVEDPFSCMRAESQGGTRDFIDRQMRLPLKPPPVMKASGHRGLGAASDSDGSEISAMMSVRSASDVWLLAARVAQGVRQAAEDQPGGAISSLRPKAEALRLVATDLARPCEEEHAELPNSPDSGLSGCFARRKSRAGEGSD